MKKSSNHRSNAGRRQSLKQCLIVVLALMMVFQFSMPTFRSVAYAEEALQTDDNPPAANEIEAQDNATIEGDIPESTEEEAEEADPNVKDATPSDLREEAPDDASSDASDDGEDQSESKSSDTKDTKAKDSDNAGKQEAKSEDKDNSTKNPEPTSDSAGKTSAEPKEETVENPEDVEEVPSGADYSVSKKKKDLEAVILQGDAAKDEASAKQALIDDAGLTKKDASRIAEEIFDAAKDANNAKKSTRSDAEDNPSTEGAKIDYVTAVWQTEDTVDNGDDGLLFLRPSDDSKQSVRIRINYSLTGDAPYQAGNVTITIPGDLFKDRDGNPIGKLLIPYAENPSTQGAYNWKKEGDNYILTNNNPLNRSTVGYVEFDITGIHPHEIEDMAITDEFQALVQVVANNGKTISLHSNPLTAQMDTKANISRVTKNVSGEPAIGSVSSIPEGMESESGKYVIVNWYVTVQNNANTEYKLDYVDYIPSSERYTGFVVGATSDDPKTLTEDNVYHGHKTNSLITYTVQTAYPIEQFEKNNEYTFHNNIAFTITEDDSGATGTKNASATCKWRYEQNTTSNAGTHFKLYKNGNDGKDGDNLTNRVSSSPRSDLHLSSNDWYGIYASALNDMLKIHDDEGENGYYDISYTINTSGYTMPWMLDNAAYGEDGADTPNKAANYTVPVTMTTKDWGISFNRSGAKLNVLDDYKYVSVEFPADPYVYKGKANKINDDGTFGAKNYYDGTFTYTKDNDRTNWPDIELQIKRSGEWEHWATASWKSGSFIATLADDTTQEDRVIAVPDDTECIRTVVKNENTATEGKTITQAAIDYDVRVVVGLRTTNSMIDKINNAFASSKTPKFYVYNRANLTAVKGGSADKLIDLGTENYSPNSANNRDGYDLIAGYSEDVKVIPSKQSSFDPEMDWNTGNNKVIIHYSAKVEERTYINSKAAYEEALETGTIDGETHAIWRDLLPEGVSPVLGTIKLREDDSIADIKTIPDYKGSGRTLLIVEANLTPHPTTYKENNITYFMDAPSISFEGEIYLNGVRNGYLDDPIHNVISFESDNDTLGTVTGYMGEPDDPRSNNNDITRIAFASDKEKDAMTDLDPDRDTPSFVYAGCNTTIDIPGAAITGLDKKVMVNNDENWSTGIYGKNPDGNRRDVYAGGPYSYRLSYMPQAENTRVKDIILFDSLENYYPNGDDEDCDEEFRFKGTLRSVDVRYLKNRGCDPVIYYYTGEEALDLTEGYIEGENLGNMDLESDIWVKAADYDGPLNAVKAVAIDASKDKDGNDFVLDADENVYAIINMTAPTIDENGNLRDSYGENFEDDPHAYNDVYCLGTTEDTATGQTSRGLMHNSYTKVGIKSYDLSIEKYWDDDNDRDGLRTENVTIDLMADGEKVDEVTLPDPKGYMDHTFNNLPYIDEDGNVIHYTFKEENIPEGYTASIQCSDNRYVLINKHVPEKITIEGEKQWVGDTEGSRPESIKINLYADGEKIQQKTVSPNSSGMWTYSFTDLNKYADGGNEIEYTVDEEMEGKLASYEGDIDGYDITNTYHPYGDLKVSKTVSQVTPQAEDKTFTFGFEFTRTETDENEVVSTVPTGKAFEYDVLDKEDNVIDGLSGYISTGQTIEIKGGQSILVKDVDEYINYRIYEEDTAGFEHVTASDVSGKIKPNKTEEVEFINKYNTEGSVEFKARKELTGHELYRYKFHYKVFLLEEDSNGKIRETLIRTASNDSPDEVTTEDGVMTSSAPINLCTLHYGIHDNDMTYTYRIEETIGRGNREDEERAVNEDGVSYADATPEERAAGGFKLDGYIYDTTSYYVTVDVTDNGDGTMTCDAVYTDNDGNPLDEGVVPLFKNTYEAKGDLTMRAWKDLKGRKLTEEEFEFELSGPYVVNENGLVELAGDALNETAKNGDSSVVTFEPISFDQTDVGKTYYFAIKEVIPAEEDADPTVNYNDKVYGYKVTVTDNGDGTLSFDQVAAIPVDSEGNQVVQDENGNFTIAAWADEDADIPVFTNTLKPGSLAVSKYVTNPDEADPDQQFHFFVRLIGEGIDDGSFGYTLSAAEEEADPEPGDPYPEPDPYDPGDQYKDSDEPIEDEEVEEAEAKEYDEAVDYEADAEEDEYYEEAEEKEAVAKKSADNEAPASKSEPGAASHTLKSGSILTKIIDKLVSLFADKAYGADDERSTEGEAYAVLTNDGDLIFFRSNNFYSNATEGTFTDILNNTYTGVVFNKIEDISFPSPWEGYQSNILKARVADGQLIQPATASRFFYGCSNMTEFDASGFDTSLAKSLNSMFIFCSSLEELDLSSFNTEAVTTMNSMFCACTNLKKINVSDFITDNVTDMSSMFGGCSSLEEIIGLTDFDTSSLTQMWGMFEECTCLGKLDLSSFTTDKVTSMGQLFRGCESLKKLDLSSFDTSQVWNMEYMFRDCKLLEEIILDKTKFDTSSVESMDSMFWGCSSLKELDLSGFNTPRLTTIRDMFRDCSSLTLLDVSNFNTEHVGNMDSVFQGCSSLETLNLSNFNTENITSFHATFKDCSSLKNLDISNFNTEKVDRMSYMFEGCSSLTELDLSHFNTDKLNRMPAMFKDCSSLESLNISSFDTSKLYFPRESNEYYDMAEVFKGTTNLKKVVLGSEFASRWRPLNDEYDSLVTLETPSDEAPYTGKWIREDGTYGPYTSQELLENYCDNPNALAGTWVWEEGSGYVLSFVPEDGAEVTGSMRKVLGPVDEDFAIPKNKFRWFGHEFVNWTDGKTRAMYTDEDTIPAGTYELGEQVTLTAHFQEVESTVDITNGEFDFYLYGGEMATFDNIPAGTAYQVWEETPDGWVLVRQVDASGEITSLGTANAKFWNQYQPGITTAQIVGAKQLDGIAAEAGRFSFELNEPDNVDGKITIVNFDGSYTDVNLPYPALTQTGGFFRFPIIVYDEDDVGTHTYTITEVDPHDSTIDYDTHTETVTVEVTQNDDGTLSSVTTYDSDGVRFYNKTRPGTLKINKTGGPLSENNKDDIFTFKITLHNENGQPLGEDEDIYWYVEENEDSGLIPIGPKDDDIIKEDSAKEEASAKLASKASGLVDDIKSWAAETWEDVKEVFTEPLVDSAYGAEGDIVDRGIFDNVAWKIVETATAGEYELVIGEEGSTQTYTNDTDLYGREWPWKTYKEQIVKVRFAGNVIGQGTFRGFFANCNYITEIIDIANLNTADVTAMTGMFGGCSSLKELNITSFNTSKVTGMNGMFSGCSSLKKLDLSSFDTRLVESMDNMFYGCTNLEDLDISSFRTPSATGMSYMFYNCKKLTELDLSRFDTKNVTQMYCMFWQCSGLQKINVSNFDTSKVTRMQQMFEGCSSLKSLDLSSFKTPKVTNIFGLFRYCRKLESLDIGNFNTANLSLSNGYYSNTYLFGETRNLKRVVLGPDFAAHWRPSSSSNIGNIALETPSSSVPYTGKWIREDESMGPYTRIELAQNYNRAHAGTWVWEVRDDRGQVWFDANGGYTDAACVTVTSASDEVTMPSSDSVYFLHHVLTGWNTKADGSGENFEPGMTYSYDQIADLGKTTTLYAQWEETNLGSYVVKHYQQNTDLETYSLVETIHKQAPYNSMVIPEVKSYEGFISPEPVKTIVKEDDSTVVKYYYDRIRYKVYFDGNGATSGSMDPVDMIGGIAEKLPRNTYQKTGSIFTGWSDTRRTTYTDGQSVVNLSKDGSDVTLYAQWMDNPNEPLEPTNGEIIVSCKAGETIVIPGLPAGTTYTVEEIDLPDGWTLGKHSDGTGTITANETNTESFDNRYNAEGHAKIEVTKVFGGGTLTEGQFEFGLYEEDRPPMLIATATNEAPQDGENTAQVVFDDVTFTRAGTYIYYIQEIVPSSNDGSIYYDTHREWITVNVTDAGGGIIDAEVVYDDDGAVFTNRAADGRLKITKEVAPGSPADETFEFEIRIYDENGNEYIDYGEEGDPRATFYYEVYDDPDNKPYFYDKAYSGVTVPMHAGEFILVWDLPAGYTYTVTEVEKPGWNLVSSENTEGTIISNETVTASFVNEYKVEGEVTFEAKKGLKGRDLTEGLFHFGIYDESGNQVSTGTNDADGKITFDPIKYTASDDGQTYNYTISEIEETIEGMTYDKTAYDVTVTVTDNKDGTLTIEKGGDYEDIVFHNTYKASGDITFKGTKTLVNKDLTDGMFTFEISETGTDNVWRCMNDADGKINYPTISYTEADVGKHTYTVKETSTTAEGIKMDTTEYTVIVEVTDNGNGTLKAETAEGSTNSNALNFLNTYVANEDLVIAGTKVMDGRELKEGESYEFTLYDSEHEVIDTANSGATGAYVFDTITYSLADDGNTYTYYVAETSEGGNGVTIDDTEYKITVSIKDLQNGKLEVKAEVDKEGVDCEHLVFTNKYEATGSLGFEGTVTIDGRDLTEDDEFTFTITDGENTWTATNDAEGNINYPEIEYTIDDVGEHTYTITQTTTDGNGLVIDTTTYTVTVIVKDNGDGTLSIEYAGDDHMELDFVNKYEATAEYTIDGTKHLDGLDLEKDQFTFELYDGNGKLLETARNDEEGNFAFETIEFTLADVGTVNYTVSEKDEGEEGFTYDDTEYEVSLEISDNGDGTLKVVPEKDAEIEFHNTFEFTPVISDPPVKKIVEGNPDTDDTFTFQMKAKTKGAPMPEGSKDGGKTVTIKGAGEYEFGEMEYYEPGKWVYELSEVDGGLKNYTYDTTKYTLTVEVTQEGTKLVKEETVKGGDGEIVFTNIYDEEKPGPKTGDTTEFMPYIMAMAISGLALLVLLLKRRKK